MDQVSADGAYDTRACHQVIMKKKAMATIPPRKNAGYWEDGHIRNEAVKALKAFTLAQWKKDVGYHQRSLSETAMYRYKTLIGNRLNFRCHDAQVAEMLVGVKALNKMLSLGMPVRREIEKTKY
ncbi:MAG: transposase [Paraglaciecola sp.]|nr:transposase [Paraglaciecola sp.]NCT49423.1 transposase [Paraglaciecola sp.]